MLRSLRSRLLAAFLLPALLLLTLAGAGGYVFARQILEDELGRSLSAIAASAASQLSAERLLSLEPGDDSAETRTYRNLSRSLTDLRDASGARRIFAIDAEGRARLDIGGALPIGAEVPELARDRLELSRVLAGERAASQVLFEGADGRLYKTGYAPLRLERRVVGAIGVEGSAAFFGPLRRLFRGFVVLVAAGLLLLAAIAVLTARGLTQPLDRLMAAALRIGGGDLQTSVPPEPLREIGVLAHELEEMRRALDGRDRQLKMMLAGVAHEVRNPIGGIELFAGLLAEDLATGTPSVPEARAQVERIRHEISYLKRIVEDFLAFAREQRLARAPISAPALLRDAATMVEADAAPRRNPLRVDAAEATLEGDPSLLLAALANLAKNAVQASPEGGEVALVGRATAQGYAIEVRNHGPGVPPELREKIFEPFFTTREKGTGLGLALARKIAQAHGGDLTLQSAPDLTTFTLALPAAKELQ